MSKVLTSFSAYFRSLLFKSWLHILLYDDNKSFSCSIAKQCVVISNYDGKPVNGAYKRLNATVFVKDDANIEGKTWMLIHKFKHSGWSGCNAYIRGFIRSDCKSRWAYINDIAKPVKGRVNIWGNPQGDSSGIHPVECGGICLTDTRKTCYEGGSSEFLITQKRSEDMDSTKCMEECNKDNDCKFVTYNEKPSSSKQTCRMYRSCYNIRTANNDGTTYSKDQNCPGIHIL